MIVVRISGGLGNQLFLYTLVQFLHYYKKDVRMDILYKYKYDKGHNGPEFFRIFESKQKIKKSLQMYSFREKIIDWSFFCAEKLNIKKLTRRKISYLCPNLFTYVYPPYLRSLFLKKINIDQYNYENRTNYADFKFIQLIKSRDFNNVVIEGCALLNPEWIPEIENFLRNTFLSPPLNHSNSDILEKINHSNSVCIHIRRGDFGINKDRTDSIILKTSYYKKAINEIESMTQNIKYFIFTDDKLWVKDNLHIPDSTIIDSNTGNNSYIDLFLMSKCKHNIIANSTFSWWGAWLNNNNDKIIIAPKFLYKDTPMLKCKGMTIIND